MRSIRCALLYLLIITLALLPVSGCAQEPETPPEPLPPEPVTLILDIGSPQGSDMALAVEELVRDFTAEHTNITVDIVFGSPVAQEETPSESSSSQEMQSSSSESVSEAAHNHKEIGQEPDANTLARSRSADVLYRSGIEETAFLAAEGALIDISSVRKEYPGFAEEIKPDALVSMVYPDGRLYAVPVLGFYEGLFVNRSLFEENALELPDDWDKLLAAVDKLAEKGKVTPIAAALKNDPSELIENLVLSAGGAKGHSQGLWADNIPQAWTQGLALIKTLYEKKAFPKSELSGEAEAVALFNKGKAAMLIGGSWLTSQIEDQDNTVVLAFPKALSEESIRDDIVGGFGSGFYISSRAWYDEAKREAAVLLTQALTSDEATSMYMAPGASQSALARSGVELMKKANGIAMPAEAYISEEVWKRICESVTGIAKGELEPSRALSDALGSAEDPAKTE